MCLTHTSIIVINRLMMKPFLILSFLSCSLSSYCQICGSFVGGYIPSYRDASAVDYTKLSHVFFSFGGTNDAGDLLINTSAFNSFATASAGKQRFLSVAGGGAHEIFSAMSANETSREAFVMNCVNFCKLNNLDGIDMDWEAITTAQDSIRFGNLIR